EKKESAQEQPEPLEVPVERKSALETEAEEAPHLGPEKHRPVTRRQIRQQRGGAVADVKVRDRKSRVLSRLGEDPWRLHHPFIGADLLYRAGDQAGLRPL